MLTIALIANIYTSMAVIVFVKKFHLARI